MDQSADKEVLHRYLKSARDALLWKLDGLDEYSARRPMTPTGTNLLGLVKHLASVGVGYFGEVFGRPSGIDLPWYPDDPDDPDDEEPNADLWVPVEQSREFILDLHHRCWAHADETIQSLHLGAVGHVPWWGDRGTVTLQQILVHVTSEAHRHAGHADIIRELIDGEVGVRQGMDNMWAGQGADYWTRHWQRVDAAAKLAGGTNE